MNFKVGDRVKIVGGYNGVLNGVYGTIELVDERDENCYILSQLIRKSMVNATVGQIKIALKL